MARFVIAGVAAAAALWVGCSVKSTKSNDDGAGGAAAVTTGTGVSTGTATGPSAVQATATTGPTASVASTGSGMVVAECNPITNEPCNTAAGEACDISNSMDGAFLGFVCYPAPNEKALCEACDGGNGPWCQGTMTCAGSKCARFCCDDGDCGTGTCVKDDGMGGEAFPGLGAIGLCLDAMQAPACDAPAAAPSNGSCVMVGGSTSAATGSGSGSGSGSGGAGGSSSSGM